MGCGNAGGAEIAVGLYVHLMHFNAVFSCLFAINRIAVVYLNTWARPILNHYLSKDKTFQFCTSNRFALA